ncbi:MAG: hypothetical protein ACI8UO_005572 [Verrucomicrobiales bacterium]|jgi:hypothetical protein
MKRIAVLVLLMIAALAGIAVAFKGKVLIWFAHIVATTMPTDGPELVEIGFRADFFLFFCGLLFLTTVTVVSALALGRRHLSKTGRIMLITRGICLFVGAVLLCSTIGDVREGYSTIGTTGENGFDHSLRTVQQPAPKLLLGLSALAIGLITAFVALLFSPNSSSASGGRMSFARGLRILESIGWIVVLGLFATAGMSIYELEDSISGFGNGTRPGFNNAAQLGETISNVLNLLSTAGLVVISLSILTIIAAALHPARNPKI